MRRTEKEIQELAEIEQIIEKATVCRLGLCCDNTPYVVPMSFGYQDGCLYLHSAKQGKKIDMLQENNRVCFEIDIECQVIASDHPCNWGMRYSSVIGFGSAVIVEDLEEKQRGLDAILAHYSPLRSYPYPESVLEHTAVIKVDIQTMTGKRSDP